MTEPPRAGRLSVAILVRDAADPLRLTLASIREVADEIIVVDTGSKDKSRDVAREFQARIIDFPWNDDFAAARNTGQQLATGDWILWLDAGETLSEDDARALRQFVATGADSRRAYVLLVRIPAVDVQAADEQIGRVRLIPISPAVTFVGLVRETCEASLTAAGLQVVGAPYLIRRGDREHDVRLKKQRAQRNIRLAELEHRQRGPSARLWNCFGDAFQTLGDNQRALECFRHARSSAGRGSPDMLEAFYGWLTSLESTENPSATQLACCIEALEIYPLDAQLLCAMGGYLHRQGHAHIAMQSYLTAYRFGQIQPIVWHISDIRDVAAMCYAALMQLQQRGDEAVQFLEGALHDHNDSVRIRRRLIEIYVGRGERETALAHVGALPKDTPHLEALRSAVRGACYASQKNWIAAKAYLNAAYGHGCRDVLCCKWLATTLLACGESEAARPILEQWARAEPRNAEPARLLTAITPAAAMPPPTADSRKIRLDRPSVMPDLSGLPLNTSLPTTG